MLIHLYPTCLEGKMRFSKGDICRVRSLDDLRSVGRFRVDYQTEMLYPPRSHRGQPPFNIQGMKYLCGQKFTLANNSSSDCYSEEGVEDDSNRIFGRHWHIGTWMLEPYVETEPCNITIDRLFS